MPQNTKSQEAISFEPKSDSDKLAFRIAQSFKDEKHLPMYRFFIEKYGAELVKDAFKKVDSIPSEKIKKSKVALFIYLLRKYARKEN